MSARKIPAKVAYVYSDKYIKICDKATKISKRASMTHELIASYNLLPLMSIVLPRFASNDIIETFHSTDYVECLKHLSACEDEEKYEHEAENFGLTYDCPAYPGVYDYARLVVGGSLTAANCLITGDAQVAINWPGGWHHAKRDLAEGFCYLNDIVISIIKLKQKYQRILYIDLDLHHGDGVEDAFCATSKVMTVSFHKAAPGFFPGTGDIGSIGIGKGKGYNLNVPLDDGTDDQLFCTVFDRVMSSVNESFPADCIVCQCGADGLAHDPMDTYNLTIQTFLHTTKQIMSWNKPLLLLGGGGYHFANTARCWTQITAAALGQTLSAEIPEHQYFEKYGPDYELNVLAGNRPNTNEKEVVENNIEYIQERLKKIGSLV